MSLTDVMIDMETLATTPDAAILTIGVVLFDPLGNELTNPTCEQLYMRVDLDSCVALNMKIDDDTIAWWSKQSKEAQDEAFSDGNRMSIQDAMQNLYKFCSSAKHIWSHGSVFDVIICENIYRKLNKTIPWNFANIRDTRTLFDLGIADNRPPVLKHHALADAWNQVVGVQNVNRKLKELLNDN